MSFVSRFSIFNVRYLSTGCAGVRRASSPVSGDVIFESPFIRVTIAIRGTGTLLPDLFSLPGKDLIFFPGWVRIKPQGTNLLEGAVKI
jgi:hypothetical protein